MTRPPPRSPSRDRRPATDSPWQLSLWGVVAPLAKTLARAGEALLQRAGATSLRPPTPARARPAPAPNRRRPAHRSLAVNGHNAAPASAQGPITESNPRAGPEARPSLEHAGTPAPDNPDRPHPRRHSDADLSALRDSLRGKSMGDKYAFVTQHMLAHYAIRVRKWRTSSSGIAWYVTYRGGRVQRLLESPKPKGPMSLAIFLHEVGHHAIGFRVHKPRCLEEYHAWKFALDTLQALDFEITDSVAKRRHNSLRYAVGKATRRGIRAIPAELAEFIHAPRR